MHTTSKWLCRFRFMYTFCIQRGRGYTGKKLSENSRKHAIIVDRKLGRRVYQERVDSCLNAPLTCSLMPFNTGYNEQRERESLCVSVCVSGGGRGLGGRMLVSVHTCVF